DKNNKFLTGTYAPVQEEHTVRECEVIGVLPDAVAGQYARNGPNPRFKPKGGYHWFDGDAMIHGVRIKSSGKVTYTNRFVQTKKLQAEEEAGQPLGFNLGDWSSRFGMAKFMLYGLKSKLGLVPDLAGMKESTANTSLEFHAGRLLALNEGGMPYALRVMCDGIIETIGQKPFEGDSKMKTAFTAHPKKDASTGKMYGFGYQYEKPFLTMYVLDANGKLERQFPVDVERSTFMHDFAITENYAVFLDLPMVLKPENIVKGAFPLVYDEALGSRMGVLPLNATDSSGIRWFDMPESFMAFHVLNAWEEKVEMNGIVHTQLKVVTCDLFEIDLEQSKLLNDLSPGTYVKYGMPQPHMNTLCLSTGKATRASLMPQPPKEGLDFPQLRRSLVGKKNRFGYFTGFDNQGSPTAVVKLDLQAATPETARVGRIDLGNWLGGEVLFIPSGDSNEDDEDDGFLVSFVSPNDGGNSGT
ncbi:unnamed protein product, partial [Scytosiphon promiscuus]